MAHRSDIFHFLGNHAEKEMEDDLNISNALAVVFDFVKVINTLIMGDNVGKKNSEDIHDLMLEFDKVQVSTILNEQSRGII